MFTVSQSNPYEGHIYGMLRTDEAQHESFTAFVDRLKNADSDNDGVSDYEEKYVYGTSIKTNDEDGDRISDINEIRTGANPNGRGRLFKDVSKNEYYTDEVGLLYQRGVLKGYDDGTFRPGNSVNRAEFVAMVMKAFNKSGSQGNRFLGIPSQFEDVKNNEWYSDTVNRAYQLGIVSGTSDPKEPFKRYFRPGDNISRAEAVTILTNASKLLAHSQETTSCIDAFEDVKSGDWFCEEVANAHKNGITSGKAPASFKPNDNLTRGEAAVMILRSLEKDLEFVESEEVSLEDFISDFYGAVGKASKATPLSPL